jgi:hypothetical protein
MTTFFSLLVTILNIDPYILVIFQKRDHSTGGNDLLPFDIVLDQQREGKKYAFYAKVLSMGYQNISTWSLNIHWSWCCGGSKFKK